jgi:IS30 family transposase
MAEEEIEALRRQRMTGPAIARQLGRPMSTVGAMLQRRGLAALHALDPWPPVVRYEGENRGELTHSVHKLS